MGLGSAADEELPGTVVRVRLHGAVHHHAVSKLRELSELWGERKRVTVEDAEGRQLHKRGLAAQQEERKCRPLPP